MKRKTTENAVLNTFYTPSLNFITLKKKLKHTNVKIQPLRTESRTMSIVLFFFFLHYSCNHMQNPILYWLLRKIPQLSPPLNYTDDCNDDNDDDDDGDVSKVSFKPERKKWRRNPTSALPQNVPLTSSLRAILDNWLEIILFHTSPWSIRPLHSSCCVSTTRSTVNQLAKNSHLGALQSNRFFWRHFAESFLICRQFIFIQTKGDHVKNITSVDSL